MNCRVLYPLLSFKVFKDKNTPSPFIEEFLTYVDGTGSLRAKPDHIYLDHMGFGMTCCALQV